MASPEFTALWPTHLMRVAPPGAEQANPVLADLIERMDAGRADMTTGYLTGDLFDDPHPAVGWFKS